MTQTSLDKFVHFVPQTKYFFGTHGLTNSVYPLTHRLQLWRHRWRHLEFDFALVSTDLDCVTWHRLLEIGPRVHLDLNWTGYKILDSLKRGYFDNQIWLSGHGNRSRRKNETDPFSEADFSKKNLNQVYSDLELDPLPVLNLSFSMVSRIYNQWWFI